MSRRTLLGVWAHPDDEAYTSAGLMATFRRRGDRVVVITATLGEHGTSDPETWPPRRLAELRHTELRNSLAALDVDELHLLGYQDGDCEREDGTQAIARHIAHIAPDLIVTFGPDGMTGHPDHRAVSRWTTDAWASTRSHADLWYATLTADFHRKWGPSTTRSGCGPISRTRPAAPQPTSPSVPGCPTPCSISRSPPWRPTPHRPGPSSSSSARPPTASGGAPNRSEGPPRPPARSRPHPHQRMITTGPAVA